MPPILCSIAECSLQQMGDSSDEFQQSYVTSMSGAGEKVNKNDAGTTFHVTILRSKSTGQMIYLEAEKNLVDVLLSFLVLPVGTIIGMLNAEGVKERKFGAMDNIYKSVENLQDSILNGKKTLLTEPRPEWGAVCGSEVLKLPANRIGSYQHSMKRIGRPHCPNCTNYYGASGQSLRYSPYEYPKGGYLKEGVTYIVGTNLEIMPTSTINVMDVLSKMKVRKFSDLLSINKEICRKDVLNILAAAISGSETPLSDTFGVELT